MFHNFNFQKKYLAFGIIVPLLLTTAFIKVPCPVCHGTGDISNTGMKDVTIVSDSFALKTAEDIVGCVNYRLYVYDVVMTLQNSSQDIDAQGYVLLGLVDSKTSVLLAMQPKGIVAPKNTEYTLAFTITFTTTLDSPRNTIVTAKTLDTQTPCPVCGGTGQLSLNRLPLVSLLNGKALAGQQVVLPNVNAQGADSPGSPWDTSNPLDT
jgi:hypothetical protein